MGQNISLTTFQAGSAGLDTPELADLVYEKSMGQARFMKTIRARHRDGVVLVKVFVKPYTLKLASYRKAIVRERKALAEIPNALSYQRIIETETNAYLVRQYHFSSLYDRMSTRPFLEDIEKKWLAFQLLCALRDCHARDVFHGDIKTENTLVTSWNWLYLTDFSSSYKPTNLPEDNPADFSYYFDTAGRRTCYVAPERFQSVPDQKTGLTWAMDIFSAGCVLAEIFLERPLFNLHQLYEYKKGAFDVKSFYLDTIRDHKIRELIMNMIGIAPESRYTADDLLNTARNEVFPEYFYGFLHQYMALVTDPSSGRSPVSGFVNLGEADERIDRIWYDFDKISYFLGYGYEKQNNRNGTHSTTALALLPVHLNIPNNEHDISMNTQRPADDGSLIFLSLVVSSLRNTARASARIRACDLLLAFGERLTDEAKLDRILPYLVTLLGDESEIVRIAALRSMTQLLALVNVISPVNANVFPEYILKKTKDFLMGSERNPSALARATYAASLGSLATTAARFLDMVATLRADGTLPTADLDVEDSETATVAAYHELFDKARGELIEIFEGHTKALITDRDSSVRRAFLGSVPELCMFFGSAESNDIILSHLNTYLNDRDWTLKCAFFDNIVGVATFLGGTSLEEFILPLMVQALTDPEEFVVARVLRSLANMAELGLFQRAKTWELFEVVSRFTMHPNRWIREAVAAFVSSSAKWASRADIICIILPLMRPYLKAPIHDFSQLALLDALKKPLPRQVLDLACNWAERAENSLFWGPVDQMRMFSSRNNALNLPRSSTVDIAAHALKQIARNADDDQQLQKLRTIGMTAEDEFKLIALREYIWRSAPARAREIIARQQTSSNLSEILTLRDWGVQLQTVMFEDQEPLRAPLRDIQTNAEKGEHGHTISDALLDASMTIDDSLARRKRSVHNSHRQRSSLQNQTYGVVTSTSPLPDAAKAKPSTDDSSSHTEAHIDVHRRSSMRPSEADDETLSRTDTMASDGTLRSLRQVRHQSSAMSLLGRKDTNKSAANTATTTTNAFGKVEGPFTHGTAQPSPLVLAKEQKIVANMNGGRLRAAHSYAGNDPSILQMLDSLFLDNYSNDLHEFGPLVQPVSKKRTITRRTTHLNDKPWRPEGVLVATFAEHVGAINAIAVSPDHHFFITGGDDGTVRVWDTGRLERNIAHRSRQTFKHANACRVISLCFVENTHCFISAGSDGSIAVVKVECTLSGTSASSKYGKLRVMREHQLPTDEYGVCVGHYKAETHSTLLIATNQSRILALDLHTMQDLYELHNPIPHGAPTTFVLDRARAWLLLGTAHGVLDLWDLRFRLRVKAWGVPGTTAIHRLVIHPSRGKGNWVCVAGGSGAGEVTVWDIETAQCREIYRASAATDIPKDYAAWPVDDERPENMLGRFATAIETGSVASGGVRALAAGTSAGEDVGGSVDGRDRRGFLVTGGGDRRLRFWDTAQVGKSLVLSGLEAEETKPLFTREYPLPTLALNMEIANKRADASGDGGSSGNADTLRGRDQVVGSDGAGKAVPAAANRAPRSTIISAQQQMLLRSHLDSVLDVAVLQSPYGMTVSCDRSGCIFVFQ